MYGAIYGDLAGSIYEYDQVRYIESIETDTLIKDESFFSDDTILTVAIKDAILNGKEYDKYLRKYIKEYKDYSPYINAPYFKTAFSPNLIRWSKNNKIGDSCGNGAMMRISPIGYMFDKEYEVIENAMLATIPTHNSKEAIDSAIIIALMIYYFRNGYKKEEVYKMLNLPITYIPFKRFNTTCNETIGNCLYSLYISNSFEDAIRNTLRMGGDTDTNCAIVGSLAEALYGMDDTLKEEVNEKIPLEFIKVLKR